jgi:hypothetical protein
MTTGTIMVLMLAVVFAGIGGAKVLAVPAVRREAQHLGFDVGRYRLIGVAELAAVAGLVAGLAWVPVAVAACGGLVALLVGAVIVLRRAGDPLVRALPAVGLGVASGVTGVLLVLGV